MKTGFTGSAGRYLLAISAFALLAVFIGAGCKSNDNGFVYKSESELEQMEVQAKAASRNFSQGKFEESSAVFNRLASERTVSQPLYMYEQISLLILGDEYDKAHELMLKLKADTDFVTDKKSEDKAKSLWHGEQNKVFKGDPYERSTLHLMLALSFLRRNDPESALSCVKAGLLFDGDTEKGEYTSDFALLQYVGALCHQRLGHTGEAEEWMNQTIKSLELRGYSLPRNSNGVPMVAGNCFESLLNPDYNCLILVWAGTPPTMTTAGHYNEDRVIIPGSMNLTALSLSCSSLPHPLLFPPKLGDLNFQAMTRGKRLMNDILKEKAFWKLFINVTSTALVSAGLVMSRANGAVPVQITGLGCIVVGGIGYIVAACINPKADPRHWKLLPGEFFLLPVKLPPGRHLLHLDGYILADQVFRQSFEVEVKPDAQISLFNISLDNSLFEKNNYLDTHLYDLKLRNSDITYENPLRVNLQRPGVHYSTKSFSEAMIKQKLEK